jgi:AbrB family looped-hinge helix DNA binding protein
MPRHEKRPTRLREAALTYVATVGDRGRLVLPSALRRRMAVKAGDAVILTDEGDGSYRIIRRADLIQRLRGSWRQAGGRRLSAELIAERRREAAADHDR